MRQKNASKVEHGAVVKLEEHDDSWDLKAHSDDDEDKKEAYKVKKEEEEELQLGRIREQAEARRALRQMRNVRAQICYLD